jgi:hypothetical protein
MMRQMKIFVTGASGWAVTPERPPVDVARRLSSEWEGPMPDEPWIVSDEL